MRKPKSEKLADIHHDVETTNVGLINVSETSETLVGLGEILSAIVLAILVLLTIKWCCKRYRRARELQQRDLELMIKRNAGPSAPAVPQQHPQEMIPMVTFQQPGDCRVAMVTPGASHWETCK